MSGAVDARIAELVARYGLPDESTRPLAQLLEALDDEHAPTTVRAPEEAIDVHLADSLAGLELPAIRDARSIADLGAGAGFPGLPLAVALPKARITLVESIARKCAFISAAARAAAIENAEVVAARAEEWADGIGRNDVVTARALAPLGVLAEYAAPLLREGGLLVAWKGRRDDDEERVAAAAAAELGLEIEEIRPVAPYAGADHRHLHLLRKVAPTPARFPRRPGMARKRPLGARVGGSSDRPQR
ncbi:16S rRNA (guanine(527)-N(7))-methyltransferase RsmG [Conexibacter arvalis]|uniref:Ribosomal RNA small subunit methyltransferase G n=1 Tax=Conexibacter arvalis TaxID=912552 RepID=A0A840IAA9_9ACTN|nr:16S rRNA (guanine527-N7)-methyltransferase [Conexibacter arvalis]